MTAALVVKSGGESVSTGAAGQSNAPASRGSAAENNLDEPTYKQLAKFIADNTPQSLLQQITENLKAQNVEVNDRSVLVALLQRSRARDKGGEVRGAQRLRGLSAPTCIARLERS